MIARRRMIPLVIAAAAACADGERLPSEATLSIEELLGGADTLHTRALAPREFVFPGDHGPHPEFRTEWWYFTGSLTSADGHELGYQLTFFRSALIDSASFANATLPPSGDSTFDRSAWRTRHAWMAHFAVTDPAAGFHASGRFARDAVGLAGAGVSPFRVWLEDWTAESLSEATTFPVRLRARSGDVAIDLTLERGKPVVLQGERGLSRKGPERGNASYYYSLTRMPTRGTMRTAAGTYAVTGTSWLDREWSTSALSPGITGWDWMSLQLDDDTELMLYRLRRADGRADPFSAATFIAADGTTHALAADAFTMMPTDTWRAADGVEYPVAWHVEIPSLDIVLDVSTPVESQELTLAVRYWEGMVHARGTRADEPVSARGYLEMTGYAGTPGAVR